MKFALAWLVWFATFDVASLKRCTEQKGPDERGRVSLGAGRVSGSHVTLQDLAASAYAVQLSQISATRNLRWIENEEFDIDARGIGDLRGMLQTLLAERFHLALKRETQERNVLALLVGNGGTKFQTSKGSMRFQGSIRQFADLLGVQATISAPTDPGRPSVASAAPLMVVDQTGLDGEFQFAVDIQTEPGVDRLTQWQRVLREQLGLRLETKKARVEMLSVIQADRVPVAN